MRRRRRDEQEERAAPAQGRRITPADIQQKVFRLAFRGYNEQDVDVFLDEVTEEVARLHAENKRLREELEAHSTVRQDLREAAEAEAILRQAREEAARIVAEAEARARSVAAGSAGGAGLREDGGPGAGGPDRPGAARVLSGFVSRERQFLQSLAGLIQQHAMAVREDVHRLRHQMASAAGAGADAPPAASPGLPGTAPAREAASAGAAAEPAGAAGIAEPAGPPGIADRPGAEETAEGVTEGSGEGGVAAGMAERDRGAAEGSRPEAVPEPAGPEEAGPGPRPGDQPAGTAPAPRPEQPAGEVVSSPEDVRERAGAARWSGGLARPGEEALQEGGDPTGGPTVAIPVGEEVIDLTGLPRPARGGAPHGPDDDRRDDDRRDDDRRDDDRREEPTLRELFWGED